jgi:hypothetical protein
VCTIEIEGDVHVIGVPEQEHPHSDMMHQKMMELAEQMKAAGYRPRAEHALHECELRLLPQGR